ncbi:unnamed protein product [Paramecium octaurelia]|uniref:Transmembrane protein n=1 Tax=Paramecium octaurelia TaxID=43137 RepID=A0A8S1SV96_PAROT|nr:unnamed protein product [Paramecium octaurelia]
MITKLGYQQLTIIIDTKHIIEIQKDGNKEYLIQDLIDEQIQKLSSKDQLKLEFIYIMVFSLVLNTLLSILCNWQNLKLSLKQFKYCKILQNGKCQKMSQLRGRAF